MTITDNSMVSVYADTMAILLLIGVLLISQRGDKAKKKDTGVLLYGSICIGVMLLSFCGAVSYALRGQTFAWAGPAVLASRTFQLLFMWLVIFQWMLYVDYKLYSSRDQLSRRYKYLFIPVLAFMLILVINLFTGIVFTVKPDMSFTYKPMYYILLVVEYIYLALSLALIYQFDRKYTGRRFFGVAPAIVPMVLGSLVSRFTDHSVAGLGFAVGLVLLYFSMANSWRFEDRSSGYYNKALIFELLESNDSIVDGIHGAIFFESDGEENTLGEILRNEMPKEGTIVHNGSGRFVLLMASANPRDMQFLASIVEDAVKEDAVGINLTTRCVGRNKDEDVKTFIRRALV